MSDLQQFKDDIAEELFGMTKDQAVEQGLCIQCKQPALANCYSEAGRREYHISGLCERCFDAICAE